MKPFTSVKTAAKCILEINAARIKYKGQTAILSINRDVTRRRLLEETIRQMAYLDSLTGLPNRSLFNDRLVQALAYAKRRSQKVTLLFLDLDGFKAINDTMATAAAMNCLRSSLRRMTASCAKATPWPAWAATSSWSCCPKPAMSATRAKIARKSLMRPATPAWFGNRILQVSCSIGMAIYPQDGRNAPL